MNIRLAFLVPVVIGALSACSANQPVASIPASGVTASNGGAQRALGGTPDVTVGNGNVTNRPFSRNSTGAADY